MPQDSYHDAQPVALIVDEGSNPFELACVCEVFGARRRPEIGRELYRFRVVTPRRRVNVRDAMFAISGAGHISEVDSAQTVFVPNRPDTETPTHPAVIEALQRAHQRGARLVGLCTGAYTLTTPLVWLNAERVDLARRLIEQGAAPLDLVAHRSGLGTTANFRAQMRRRTGLSPSQYRARFAAERP